MRPPLPTRKVIVVAIALFVALLHLVTGPSYGGPFPGFVNGYLIDVLLPFAMFLVLGVGDWPLARRPWPRALAVFAVGAITETLQAFGVPILGRTFDPLDYVMFALGIGLALLFERHVLKRLSSRALA